MWFTGQLQASWRSGLLAAGLLLSTSWYPGVSADPSAADYFIHDLPGAPDGPLLKMHAGHIEITPEHHGNLFFWHYQNRHIANKQRTVIWLNGGPGCSSMDGALMEVGPYRVRQDGKLEYNDGSWDEFANLLFVDNPVGTGFSYVDTNSYIHELNEMATQFVAFLEKWFDLFPEYMHDDIYIAGESYAGQHIPYIAQAILNRNNDPKKDPWSLAGLLIGNGWISPVDQYLAYLPFAYQNGLIQGGTAPAEMIERQQAQCLQFLSGEGGHSVETSACEKIMTDILDVTKNRNGETNQRCLNMYDIRLRDDDSCGMNWPPDLKHVTPYLRDKKVTEALHINPDKRTGWSECSGAVSSSFHAKNSAPSIDLLPGLLEHVPIVLFSGDKDMICNHIGTEELINNMEWNGGKGWELSPGVTAPRRDWSFENEPAGIYQEARNLTYIKFYNSSHMVPFDYARRSRDMLDRFMGVDINSIGGKPADSIIDGEKGPLTSVGNHPNSTAAQEAQKDRLQQAAWKAYYRSGEIALIVVIILASLWGWFVWRDRRRRAGYRGLWGNGKAARSAEGREGLLGGMGLESFRSRRSTGGRDLEAADFDERELDNVSSANGRRKEYDPPAAGAGKSGRVVNPEEDRRYSLGEASDSGAESETGNRAAR